MPNPRVFDGEKWESIQEEDGEIDSSASRPMKPVEDGNGQIFVSVPSYRDGTRCATTIKTLFDKASDPSKIFFGIVEQNDPKDVKCLVKYCALNGVQIHPRRPKDPARAKCPHFDQIRYLAVYNLGAKGPVYARALMRRLISDEEYVLQIDAHTDAIQSWDEELKSQWRAADNEYAIISTIPPSLEDKKNGVTDVRRMCRVNFAPTHGIPWYKKPVDALAQDLGRPLLSHSWCAGFSFSKSHLEITAPYDVFMPQMFDTEEFVRFARFWTRGYDAYTPTKNIIYHNYGKNPDGNEAKDWPNNNLQRKASIKRIKTILNLGKAGDASDHANLGLYGLGKRRSLSQLEAFCGIDMQQRTSGNHECGDQSWVSYDLSISPFEHLYTAEDSEAMDPQPEYPLRKDLSAPFVQSISDLGVDAHEIAKKMLEEPKPESLEKRDLSKSNPTATTPTPDDTTMPFKTLCFFWILGLVIWFKIFAADDYRTSATARKKKKRYKDSKKMG